jgi:iron-sulfur cluster insertion protein
MGAQNKVDDITITDSAIARIGKLIAEAKSSSHTSPMFRVSVSAGGCSGFQYEFALDEKDAKAHDIVIEQEGIKVVIDDISLSLIKGSELHYHEDLGSAAFVIINPNAKNSCGCGNSFSV